MAKKRSITDIYFEGTTIVPHDIIDNTLISNAKESSDHLSESVNALQSAIRILFPKKDQNERNFSIDQQSLLIGCLIKRAEASEEQRRACKGLHEKNDKNVYYEFDDKLLDEKSTEKDIDNLPIHIEHINVARVENNKDKSINDTIEKIQKLISIENRLINNETNREKINLDSILDFSSTQNLINQSTPFDVRLNTMDVNRSKNGNHGGMFLWSSNNDTIDKTTGIFSNLEIVKQIPQYESTYSINKQNDTDDQNFETNENLSKFNKKKFSFYNEEKPLSLLSEENIMKERNDGNYTKLDINVDNDTDITSSTNNNYKKLEQENKSWNESTIGVWSIGRLSNDPTPKNVLLTDLTKALETLEIIVDGKGLDSDGDQISFKPADLRSIIKSRKFSGKFLQFLNTIKNTIEQSNTTNKTNSIN